MKSCVLPQCAQKTSKDKNSQCYKKLSKMSHSHFLAKIVEIAPLDSNINFWRENSNFYGTSAACIVLK